MKGKEAMFNLTEEDLKKMEAVDIRTVDINTLTDIRDIQIDSKMSTEKKLISFAEQSNNLYLHRFGDYVVKVKFQQDGYTIDDKMEEYLKHLMEIQI